MARCKNTDMLMSAIKKAGGGKVQTSADTARKLATEMGGMRKGGKVQTSADTARKLATEMGGAKKGGRPQSGLAVMIAIGSPMKGMKKPIKEKATGEMYASKKAMAKHEAAESAGMERMERMNKPVKKAQGGVGKVRKGMMSPEGKMLRPVKPKSGLGSSY